MSATLRFSHLLTARVTGFLGCLQQQVPSLSQLSLPASWPRMLFSDSKHLGFYQDVNSGRSQEVAWVMPRAYGCEQGGERSSRSIIASECAQFLQFLHCNRGSTAPESCRHTMKPPIGLISSRDLCTIYAQLSSAASLQDGLSIRWLLQFRNESSICWVTGQ